jgi:glycosyltransferase involved in cell wall biosynthesis
LAAHPTARAVSRRDAVRAPGETPPTVALLKAQNYAEWKTVRDRGEAAGSLGPYSVDRLEAHGFEVRHSDAVFEAPWSNTLLERVLGRLGRQFPELLGLRNALANRRLVTGSDMTLGIFEDQGSFAAFARGHHLWPVAPRRMVLMVCWMAEWAQNADPRALRGYRRVLAGADLVVFFSENQAEVFEGTLGVDPARLLFTPFGIDQCFFAEEPTRDEGYVLAVGGDWSRDHELLVEAVRDTGIPTKIYAPVLDVADLPSNVTWIPEVIDHVTYRRALSGARLVVVPTIATKYPGGQTVLLEAMASSKPVVTTRSEAMRGYVSHGINGVLVPPGDAHALRQAIQRVLADDALRASLASNGRSAVERTFNQATMWAVVAERMHRLLHESSRGKRP